MTKVKKLIDAGYQAALASKPCDAPTTREIDRAAWEQGWRAGHADRTRVYPDHIPLSDGRSVWVDPAKRK